MKFVVTGGAGFIGNRIVRSLLKNNHSVTIIDNLSTGKIENLKDVQNKIEFIKTDIRNYEYLEKIIKNYDGIFHEAALTLVQESFTKQKEYNDVNVTGTENIFKIAQKNNIKVVYASSSSIYGDVKKIPISESFSKNPINPYGITKLKDEELAIKYSKLGLKVGQTGSYAGVITKFINRLKKKQAPQINGNGEQIRDFIFVDDIADANITAMNSSVNSGFFNIGSGIGTTIKQLANDLIEVSGEKVNPIYSNVLEGDVKFSQADISLTEKMLQWKSKTKLIEGLKKIYPDFD
jgi:nucleoside-diphosphate-sugar epimerase